MIDLRNRKNRLFAKLDSKDKRSSKAKKNIIASIFIKGIDTLTQLLLVPVTLGYLNQYEYGIWLTISSILVWINSFDIGLGNGLRNRLAEGIAQKRNNLARIYVSTTLVLLILLMSFISMIGLFVIHNINLYNLLGISEETVPNLIEILEMSFALFCFNFVVKFVGNVYQGLQLPAVNNMFVTLGHIISLILIYVLTKTTNGSLFLVALGYSISQPLVYVLAYPITFYKLYPFLKPSLKLFKFDYLKDLLSIGVRFFVIQLAGVILFSMSNIIISRKFGPNQVSLYNVAYRYFSIISMIVTILLSPMWTAVTDAHAQKNVAWIKKSLSQCRRILYGLLFAMLLMIVLSPLVFDIWLHNQIEIPTTLTILMALYIYLMAWSLCYSYFLNGMGLLRIQTYHTVVTALVFYPLCHFMGNLIGINGILLAMVLLLIPGLLLNIVQLHIYITNPNNKFWNK